MKRSTREGFANGRCDIVTLFSSLFSICEIEFAKLTEHLNSRLQVDPAHESVDLDNLFAFLSDVQSGRSADNVGDRMKEIVSDFDEVIIRTLTLRISGLHVYHVVYVKFNTTFG